jgi:hypothetical protein
MSKFISVKVTFQATFHQVDQMSFKKSPKMQPTTFVSNLMHNLNIGKSRQIMWAISVIFRKLPKVNDRPLGDFRPLWPPCYESNTYICNLLFDHWLSNLSSHKKQLSRGQLTDHSSHSNTFMFCYCFMNTDVLSLVC